jgi:hypothetical protein
MSPRQKNLYSGTPQVRSPSGSTISLFAHHVSVIHVFSILTKKFCFLEDFLRNLVKCHVIGGNTNFFLNACTGNTNTGDARAPEDMGIIVSFHVSGNSSIKHAQLYQYGDSVHKLSWLDIFLWPCSR